MTHEQRFRLGDASIRLDSMPVSGRDVDVTPDASERAFIAEQIGVTSVDALSVKLHAVRFRGGIRVTGTLKASVEQPSVVTLDPVRQEISEPVDRIFLPGAEKDYADLANAEVFVDLEGEDIPDHFEGNEADLTDLIVETLVLAVDLYPRAEGESIEALGLSEKPADEHPFAALKALKPKQE
jgi:uncharacterized metal-binding protein YceD (DUF177 family)